MILLEEDSNHTTYSGSMLSGEMWSNLGTPKRNMTMTESGLIRNRPEDNENRFRVYMEHAPLAIFIVDEHGSYVEVNEAACRMTGYSREELSSMGIRDLASPEAPPADLRVFGRLKEMGTVEEEILLRRKDGSDLPTLLRAVAISENRLMGFCTDLSERDRAERALRESEERYSAALRASNDGLWDWNVKTGETYFGPRYYTMLGYEPDEMPASYETWRDLLHPDDLERTEAVIGSHIGSEREAFATEFRLRTKDGGWKWILGRGQVVERDEDGHSTRMVGTHTDISELKRSEERFRALTEYSIDTIMRFDREHRHLYVNPVVEKQTGMKPEEFIGKTHLELGFPEDLCALWAEAIDGVFETAEPHRIDFSMPDGTVFDWQLTPEISSEGSVSAVITSARDITKRKKAEEDRARLEDQLRQSQKMESIGRLAGGVAHDFNNILTGILGYAEVIQSTLIPGDPILSDLEEIRKAAERASGLTSQLLAFSRKQIIDPKVIQPNAALESSQNMLSRIIGEDIDSVFSPQVDLWRIKADPAQVDQILVNLAVNARDAMPDGGKLTIETQNVSFDAEYCDSNPEAKPGKFVMLAVTDNGHGMDAETRRKIFEPFFSTKGGDEGTGLGLSTVYGIVRQNGGFINVYSEPGRGTTFKAYFPAVMDEAEEVTTKEVAEHPSGSETILLVEDEEMVRRLAVRVLEKQGYEVLGHDSGGTALLFCERNDHPIDLIVTDVVLPGMNGRELFEKVQEGRPGIKVLFMSGYTENVIAHHGVLEEGTEFIQKPFTIEALTRKVRAVLDR